MNWAEALVCMVLIITVGAIVTSFLKFLGGRDDEDD